uniref:Uncharacterized protein n=1 Tax=Rhizophora mucronata TaxID=61149 RepID=A0A2P2PML9_RHIMU
MMKQMKTGQYLRWKKNLSVQYSPCSQIKGLWIQLFTFSK